MAITLLSNESSGAPTLNGAAGSLIGVLDFCLVDTLGWGKAFSDTNKASYRAPSGNRMYLGIDDTTTLNARVRGFETMTAAGVAVASGTGPFPTDAQVSGGGYIYKGSDTTTARPWRFASDGTMFYLTITSATYPILFSFGDIISFKASDAFGTLISGEGSASTSAHGVVVTPTSGYAPTGAHALARSYTQLGSAVLTNKIVDGAYGAGSGTEIGSNGIAYPSPVEGGLILSRVRAGESALVSVRGIYPGLWAPCHVRPLTDGDTFTGTGDLDGRAFVAWNVGSSGQAIIETSDTWRS